MRLVNRKSDLRLLHRGESSTEAPSCNGFSPVTYRQAPLLLSRAQSRFWALLFIGQSCLVHVWRFSRILSTLRDRLQDVPKPGPLTEIAHLGSTWFFIHGTVGLTMDLPCNMAVYAPSLSIFLLSQFPTAPLLSFCAHPRPPPKSWFYLLHDQRAVGPVHGIMIFAFVSSQSFSSLQLEDQLPRLIH